MYHYSKLLNSLSFRKSYFNLHLLKEIKNVTLIGWIKSITKLKNKTFLKLHDGRTDQFIQVVFKLVQYKLYTINQIYISGYSG